MEETKAEQEEVYRWIHKYKKVGWNDQPAKCPLLKHVRFSAYQMSITPDFPYFPCVLCSLCTYAYCIK